jgi:hypothetical protein
MPAPKKTVLGVLMALTLYGCGNGSDSNSANIPGSSNPPIIDDSTTLSLTTQDRLTLFPEQNATFTLKNTGNSTAHHIHITSTNTNITFDPNIISSLAPEETTIITLTVNKNNKGSSSLDHITANGDDTDTPTLPLQIIPIIFPQDPLQIGSGNTLTWTLTNQGDTPVKAMSLSINLPITISSASTCGSSPLQPQASCEYIFMAPNEAQSQAGALKFTADGAVLDNKPVNILRPTYEISVIQPGLETLPASSQIPVNPSQKTIVQVFNNSPVTIKNFQVSLPTIPNVIFNNQCSTAVPPYDILPESACTIEISPNDLVTQGDQGTLSFSEDNADTPTSDYQVIVASQAPPQNTIQNFYLQSNTLISTAGVNYPVWAFLNIQTTQPNQDLTKAIPLNLTVNNNTSSCTINALNTRNSCGWEATQYQCNPVENIVGSNAQCIIKLDYAIPLSPNQSEPESSEAPKNLKKVKENFTFLFNDELPQTLSLTEMQNFYLFLKDTQEIFNNLPVSKINDIQVDTDGTIYLATTSGLLYSHDEGNTWKWFGITDGLPYLSVTTLLIDGSKLYLGSGDITSSALVTLDIQNDPMVIEKISDSLPEITKIISLNGSLYVSTQSGAYRVDSEGKTDPLPHFMIGQDPESNPLNLPPIMENHFPYASMSHSEQSIFLALEGFCVGEYDFANTTEVKNLFCIPSESNQGQIDTQTTISNDHQSHLLYLSGADGNAYLSENSGLSFQKINSLNDLQEQPITATFNHNSSEIALGTTAGLLLSQNLGNSWNKASGTEGLWIKNIYSHSNGSYYLTTQTGISFNHAGNTPFSSVTGDDLSDAENAHIFITPLNLYLIKKRHDGTSSTPSTENLFISHDRGVSFNNMTPSETLYDTEWVINTDPSSLQDHILLNKFDQVLLSDDLGKTWIDVTPPVAFNPENEEGGVMSIAMCTPQQSQNLNNLNNANNLNSRSFLISTHQQVFLSSNNAQSWNTVMTGQAIHQVGYLSALCNEIIIADKNTIKASLDGGETWPIEFSPPETQNLEFFVDSNKNIFINQDNINIWVGTPKSENSTQYEWKMVPIETTSINPHKNIFIKIDKDLLYIFNSNNLLTIPVSTLFQKSSITEADFLITPLNASNQRSLQVDVITDPDTKSAQIAGYGSAGPQGLGWLDLNFIFGKNISILPFTDQT